MAKLTKKQKAFEGKVESTKLYALVDALGIVKECATAKFDESIDVAVQLGLQSQQIIHRRSSSTHWNLHHHSGNQFQHLHLPVCEGVMGTTL